MGELIMQDAKLTVLFSVMSSFLTGREMPCVKQYNFENATERAVLPDNRAAKISCQRKYEEIIEND